MTSIHSSRPRRRNPRGFARAAEGTCVRFPYLGRAGAPHEDLAGSGVTSSGFWETR
jgi:hypothetical protein